MTDTLLCVVCGEHKSWKRFRPRNNDGTFRESDTCSTCRNRISASKRQKKQSIAHKVVLNRTVEDVRKELGYNFYYPKIEKSMRAYCNKKTAMDRKYLRDNQDKPISITPRIAQQQTAAREHAKGWIGFYDDICNHATNLLRQTGTRPPWAQMEGSGTLQLAYGVYHTKRAQLLRDRG